MATFEEVIHEVRGKPLSERSDTELQELLIRLRKVRTDVPDSPVRRRKKRSIDHLTSRVEEAAKRLGKDPQEILDLLLQDKAVADSLRDGGDDETT